MRNDHVAIVGGGFSGTMLAINLLRHDGPRATLIERRPQTARGVAYSTVHPGHLLNVRAANMSALPDDPGHFVRWLAARGEGGEGFVPRQLYGAYLDELLVDAMARGGDRLRVVRREAVDVAIAGEGATVTLDDGATIGCDRVALALGNLPPVTPGGIEPEALPAGVYVADPWSGAIDGGLDADDTVLVLGTGLTMIDIALLFDAAGFAGRVVALSRRGLVPLTHAAVEKTSLSERPEPRCGALLPAVRSRAGAVGWRAAVDELRPYTQGIWRALPRPEQHRFLRHLRPWWDIHRHRIAPEVATRIARMRESGRLEIVAGRLVGVDGDAVATIVRRGETAPERLAVARIVNGTGPQGDVTRSDEPLLRRLVAAGLVRPDPLHIGIDVDQESRALDLGGDAQDRLFVLGPMTRGAFWEIVAVPDIRRQAWSVARYLSDAHWVEGEGL